MSVTVVYWKREGARAAATGASFSSRLENEGRAKAVFGASSRGRVRAPTSVLGPVRDDIPTALSRIMTVSAMPTEAADLVARLAADPMVTLAHVAPPRTIAARVRSSASALLAQSWRSLLNLPKSWPGALQLPVAVIDSGADVKHPALGHVLLSGAQQRDRSGHGTHVVGLIGARSVGGWTLLGLAHDVAQITVHQALEPYVAETYYRALRVALVQARVLNLSLSGDHDPTEELILDSVGRGCCVVAAMGNEFETGNARCYPAALSKRLPHVVAVGAVDGVGKWAPFSCTGPHVTVAAPGVDIGSTAPTTQTPGLRRVGVPPAAVMSGTSMATPIVSGVLTLVLSKYPHLTPTQLRTVIRGNKMGNKKNEVGVGVIDAVQTLAAASQVPVP